jgi:hypothetical protein
MYSVHVFIPSPITILIILLPCALTDCYKMKRTLLVFLAIATMAAALTVDRRRAIGSALVGGAAGWIGINPAAFAAGAVPTPEELERIRIGYKQINYLLNNFEVSLKKCLLYLDEYNLHDFAC